MWTTLIQHVCFNLRAANDDKITFDIEILILYLIKPLRGLSYLWKREKWKYFSRKEAKTEERFKGSGLKQFIVQKTFLILQIRKRMQKGGHLFFLE